MRWSLTLPPEVFRLTAGENALGPSYSYVSLARIKLRNERSFISDRNYREQILSLSTKKYEHQREMSSIAQASLTENLIAEAAAISMDLRSAVALIGVRTHRFSR
jgi:hypothetical protein